jgi:hypothetical protein
MSKKNRWRKNTQNHTAAASPTAANPPTPEPAAAPVTDISLISPAQLAANRANALLSTGPRTQAGLAKSSRNAVKSGLTSRTVLLPTDDVEEYAAFLASFQDDLKPVGPRECELVQIVVDCHWRLRRIQELEFALYAHGGEQFADAFPDIPTIERRSKIMLQTHLTYEKQFRNLHIQEARIDRKRAKALAELETLQSERRETDIENDSEADESGLHGFSSERELFAALDAGYVPPYIASRLAAENQNGFEFSNSEIEHVNL